MTELQNAVEFNPHVVKNLTNLTKIFLPEDMIETFKNLIISQSAIISGGTVVRSLLDGNFCFQGTPYYQIENTHSSISELKNNTWISDDMDIYVHAKNCIPLRNFLMENFTSFEIPKPVDDNGKIQKKDSTYTTSLFKRSKIIKIIRFNALSFKPMFTGRNTPIHIDLMIVSNSVSLPDVIQKFDLSCCKVFFDGVNVQGWNLADTIQYKATLDKYFISALLTGKKKIQERMEKYKSRGFSIKVDIPIDYVYGQEIKQEEPEEKIVLTFEEKTKRKFYDLVYSILFGTIYKTNAKLAKSYILNLRNVLPAPSADATLMCTSPKNKNRVWSMFSNYHWVNAQKMEYQDDGYDREDFNSADDYTAAGKQTEFNKIIKYLTVKYQSILKSYNQDSSDYEEDSDDDYDEEIHLNSGQKSNEKFKHFCTVILPEFLKIMGLNINALNQEEDHSKFLDSIPEHLECFVEEHQDDVKIKEFLSKKRHIIVRSGENVKGYVRSSIVKYIRNNEKFYSGEKIRPEDIEKLNDRNYRLFDLKNTGLPYYILVEHINTKFLTTPQSPKF
jgi:hypothetical protein